MKQHGRAIPVLLRTLIGVAWLVGSFNAARAADPRTDTPNNKGVVELEVGGSAGISVRMAEDLAALVDDGATRRVLPVIGRNALQTMSDLARLRGIDLAVLPVDVLDALRQRRGTAGVESFSYVAKLYNEELHILAGPDVKSVSDLAHRKVNVGVRGSGTAFTAMRLFDLLGVQPDYVNDGEELALEKLRHGEIAGVAFVSGKPAGIFRQLGHDGGLHFVPVPLVAPVVSAYVPTTLTAADYPDLVPGDRPVDTVAVSTVLLVAPLTAGSERYKNVANFVDVFFTEFNTLLEPGWHPKWHEINLAAELPGWHRFPPAQQWLDRNAPTAKQTPQDVKALFSRFVDTRQQVIGGTPISEGQKQELFEQFRRWESGQSR